MSEHPAVAWLQWAHKRATALARAATPSPWTVDSEIHPESIDSAGGVEVVAGSRWRGEASVFETAEDARHIAMHDPAAVLRRVEAERRILLLHPLREVRGPEDRIVLGKDGLQERSSCLCATCGGGFPCPTVRLLAEAWGWTEETR